MTLQQTISIFNDYSILEGFALTHRIGAKLLSVESNAIA